MFINKVLYMLVIYLSLVSGRYLNHGHHHERKELCDPKREEYYCKYQNECIDIHKKCKSKQKLKNYIGYNK